MDERSRLLRQLLGKTVHVEIDRPIGYRHGDIVYPVNYGYIPGIIAGDGEPQDAYILGVSQPLTAFDGRVIGAIRRKDDCEDKLVVAPEGMLFHQGEIAGAVHFQERYFRTSVDSLLRKSCGVVPYRKVGAKTEFLVLLQTNNCWSFPKGHMDAGETECQTALRELREETGLQATLIPGVRAECEYAISPLVRKQLVLFPGRIYGDMTLQRQEILSYRWVSRGELKNFLHPDTCTACEALLLRCLQD